MLSLKNLSITFKSTNHSVIHNLSIEVGKGEIVAVMGPSGCGKTTLLNAIQGILSPEETILGGEIRVRKAAKIHTVFQEPRLLPWRNVINNITFGLETKGNIISESNILVDKVMSRLSLDDFKDYFPRQLSLGMKQRVNFARALVCEPDILLLDEPFSSLDRPTKLLIMTDFKKIIKNKKIATVFVTHSLEEANFIADKIIKVSK